MIPNWKKTLRQRIAQAKKFDNLHKRPNTDDWCWWDNMSWDDCERSEPLPKQEGMNPHST